MNQSVKFTGRSTGKRMLSKNRPIVSCVGFIFIVAALQSNPAYSSNLKKLEINFYNDRNELAGNGTFTYELGKSTFISTCNNFDCNGNEGFYVDNVLQSWDVNLSSRQWNADNFPSYLNTRWWDAGSSTVKGAFYDDRYGLFTGLDDAWIMRPTYIDFIGFEMRGSSGKGSSYWTEYYPIDPQSGGYWIAVPEPLTILGTGTAIGMGAFFKHQQTKKQEKKKAKAL